MILLVSLVVALGVTLWLVSYVARMLQAKRPGIGWVFLSWLSGGILSSLALVLLGLFAQDMDPMLLLIATVVIVMLVSTAAYKIINEMGWGSALSTNVASNVISLITLIVAIVVSGNSLKDTFKSFNSLTQQNIEKHLHIAGAEIEGAEDASISTDNAVAPAPGLEEGAVANDADADSNQASATVDDEEPVFKETDLLPKGAVDELLAKEKPYVSPKYHVVRIGSLNSLIGRPIRIHKRNGKVVAGALQKIRGHNALIKQRIYGGEATTPVSIAAIRKLEVFR